MSINSYLSNLQSNLVINGTEEDKIKKSINAISTRLDSYFGEDKTCEHRIIKKEIFGSYSRGTMLPRRYDEKSDIDFMIIFEDANNYNPQTCLNWLKGFAERWYPFSIVKQSLPTIVLELENLRFELVPGYESYGMKYVAWNSVSWQYTDTEKIKEKMLDLNKKTNFEFKRMIRTIKYWNITKNYRKYKSFELEDYLTNNFQHIYSNCNSSIDYLEWAFYFLRSFKYVDEYVNDRVIKTYQYVEDANYLEKNGQSDLAIAKIKKVFE